MKVHWPHTFSLNRRMGIYLTKPSDFPLQEYPFGFKFYERCFGFVLCLGWIQVGFRFWTW